MTTESYDYIIAGAGSAGSVLAGLIGAHLQRGGMAIMTTHQAVEIPAGAVRELRIG